MGPYDSILTFCDFSITYVRLNLLGPHLLLMCWNRLAETLPKHNILNLTEAGKTENSYEPSSDCAHSLHFREVTSITKYPKLSIDPYGKTPQGQITTANFTASISTRATNSKWPNCIPVSSYLNHSDSNKNKITEIWPQKFIKIKQSSSVVVYLRLNTHICNIKLTYYQCFIMLQTIICQQLPSIMTLHMHLTMVIWFIIYLRYPFSTTFKRSALFFNLHTILQRRSYNITFHIWIILHSLSQN